VAAGNFQNCELTSYHGHGFVGIDSVMDHFLSPKRIHTIKVTCQKNLDFVGFAIFNSPPLHCTARACDCRSTVDKDEAESKISYQESILKLLVSSRRHRRLKRRETSLCNARMQISLHGASVTYDLSAKFIKWLPNGGTGRHCGKVVQGQIQPLIPPPPPPAKEI
jgi:hypothetical protein